MNLKRTLLLSLLALAMQGSAHAAAPLSDAVSQVYDAKLKDLLANHQRYYTDHPEEAGDLAAAADATIHADGPAAHAGLGGLAGLAQDESCKTTAFGYHFARPAFGIVVQQNYGQGGASDRRV